MTRHKKKNQKKRIAIILIALLMTGAVTSYFFYMLILEPNLNIDQDTHLYVPTGSEFDDVVDIMESNNLLRNSRSFVWLAHKKKYPSRVLPGRYLLRKRMGNNELINLLRSGKQDPVRLMFNNIRTKYQLAGHLSHQIEADSASLASLFSDIYFLDKYGHNPETAILLFIPNTYEFYWNTSAEAVFERMHREFTRFWSDDRLSKARNIRLSPKEVMILASIVQRETNKADEMAKIAGVYINRLRRNMLLQADPTVIYAVGDFTIKRVLHRHLAIDSPYNTYRYPGLPPGPIGLPDPPIIDSILNYENHDFLFFCAKDDFSGYHAFAKTYSEHLVNARRYQQALNKRNITR